MPEATEAADTAMAPEPKARRGKRRVYKGFVESTAMQKTISVKVKKLVKHPMYEKYVRRATKLLAHDEEGKAAEGDFVEIVESRPLSKRKHFRLLRVVRAAPR